MKREVLLTGGLLIVSATCLFGVMQLRKADQTIEALQAQQTEKKQYCNGVAAILSALKADAHDRDINAAYAAVMHMAQYCIGVQEDVEDDLAWTLVSKDPEAIQKAISVLRDQVLDASQ